MYSHQQQHGGLSEIFAGPLPPGRAKSNPFADVADVAYAHGARSADRAQITSMADRIELVKSFTLEQCRQALALWNVQKGVSMACVKRIKQIYRESANKGNLKRTAYPLRDDTLAFLRRMDAAGEMPVPFDKGVQALLSRICAMEGCSPTSTFAKRHCQHLSGLLMHQDYLYLDPNECTIAFQEAVEVRGDIVEDTADAAV